MLVRVTVLSSHQRTARAGACTSCAHRTCNHCDAPLLDAAAAMLAIADMQQSLRLWGYTNPFCCSCLLLTSTLCCAHRLVLSEQHQQGQFHALSGSILLKLTCGQTLALYGFAISRYAVLHVIGQSATMLACNCYNELSYPLPVLTHYLFCRSSCTCRLPTPPAGLLTDRHIFSLVFQCIKRVVHACVYGVGVPPA